MLGFLKKIFGLPTDEELAAAKMQLPVVNERSGDLVDVGLVPPAVNDQITDSVTQAAPAKKPRKPRTPKVEKVVKETSAKEKAAKVVKPAAVKRTRKSKNA